MQKITVEQWGENISQALAGVWVQSLSRKERDDYVKSGRVPESARPKLDSTILRWAETLGWRLALSPLVQIRFSEWEKQANRRNLFGQFEKAVEKGKAISAAVVKLSQEFEVALKNQIGSDAILKAVTDKCDIQIVACMAYSCLFALDQHKRTLRLRGQKKMRDFRRQARELARSAARFEILDYYLASSAQAAREQNNRKIDVAGNSRLYDPKREGVAMDNRMLWIFRAYVQNRTGHALKSSDLTLILNAVHRTVYPKATAMFDPETVSRNLRNFEKTRAKLLHSS